MTLSMACRSLAEGNVWVATLSMDEPMATAAPWRLFQAAGWMSCVLMHATDPPPRPAVREVEQA